MVVLHVPFASFAWFAVERQFPAPGVPQMANRDRARGPQREILRWGTPSQTRDYAFGDSDGRSRRILRPPAYRLHSRPCAHRLCNS